MKINKKKLFILGIPLIVGTLAQLIFTNIFAGGGEELASIEKRLVKIKEENSILQESLTTLKSLQRIAKESQAAGLGVPGEILYIDASDSLATSGNE